MLDNVIKRITSLDSRIIGFSNKTKAGLILIVAIFFFGTVLKLNTMTLMWSDDFMYYFIYNTSDKIRSFSDLIHSQYQHYMLWGGRSVGHTIVQILLMLDPLLADFINTFGYIFLVLVIYQHAKGTSKQHNISLFILINLLIWFFAPYYGETILWITGSGNYMWCTLFILLFLLPYRLYQGSQTCFVKNLFVSIGMFFLGIIAGWTNENVAIGMILMAFFWLILFKKQKWGIPLWAIIGIIGAIVGYCFLVLAPGNFVRFASSGATDKTYNLFFVYFKFNMYTARLANMIGFITVISGILFILVLKFKKLDKNYFIFTLLIYLIGVLVPVYAMIPSPTFPDRAWFGTVIFAIIIFGFMFYNMNYNLVFIRNIRSLIVGLFFIAFIFNFYGAYKDVKYIQNMWIERDLIIKDNIKEGVDTIRVPALSVPYSRYTMFDAEFASKDMSKYYKANVQIVSQ